MKTLIGTKIGMTQIIQPDGVVVPVTLIQAGPCTVTRVKSTDSDGYNAVQIGYGQGKNPSNAVNGQLKKSGLDNYQPQIMREIRDNLSGEEKVGDVCEADIFNLGDSVDVIGTSKGKGWAGTIKRHNFQRHRKTHGGKGNTRKVGSIGSMYPQKVWRGHPMAGRMGGERVTVKNLTVAFVSKEDNLVGVKGAVPGPRKGLVMIQAAKRHNHLGEQSTKKEAQNA
jgi:large subunit ribosomal protein L3